MVGCPVGTFAKPNDLVTGNVVVDVASCPLFVKELGRIELLMLKLPKLTLVVLYIDSFKGVEPEQTTRSTGKKLVKPAQGCILHVLFVH